MTSKRSIFRWTALAGAALLTAFSIKTYLPEQDTQKQLDAPSAAKELAGGAISGKVTYAGGKVRKVKNVIKDEGTCGAHDIMDKSLLTSADGGLQWAVVSITNIDSDKPVTADNVQGDQLLDQSGCEFKPHVLLVGVNQPLAIMNSDKTLHNVRTQAFMNDPFNKAQIYMPGQPKPTDTTTFAEAEVVEVVCDVHGWMKSYVHVIEHPYYAVTDENGSFTIPDVPAGKYELKVWHETLDERTQEVKVSADGQAEVNFEFPEK